MSDNVYEESPSRLNHASQRQVEDSSQPSSSRNDSQGAEQEPTTGSNSVCGENDGSNTASSIPVPPNWISEFPWDPSLRPRRPPPRTEPPIWQLRRRGISRRSAGNARPRVDQICFNELVREFQRQIYDILISLPRSREQQQQPAWWHSLGEARDDYWNHADDDVIPNDVLEEVNDGASDAASFASSTAVGSSLPTLAEDDSPPSPVRPESLDSPDHAFDAGLYIAEPGDGSFHRRGPTAASDAASSRVVPKESVGSLRAEPATSERQAISASSTPRSETVAILGGDQPDGANGITPATAAATAPLLPVSGSASSNPAEPASSDWRQTVVSRVDDASSQESAEDAAAVSSLYPEPSETNYDVARPARHETRTAWDDDAPPLMSTTTTSLTTTTSILTAGAVRGGAQQQPDSDEDEDDGHIIYPDMALWRPWDRGHDHPSYSRSAAAPSTDFAAAVAASNNLVMEGEIVSERPRTRQRASSIQELWRRSWEGWRRSSGSSSVDAVRRETDAPPSGARNQRNQSPTTTSLPHERLPHVPRRCRLPPSPPPAATGAANGGEREREHEQHGRGHNRRSRLRDIGHGIRRGIRDAMAAFVRRGG